jgi:hypothetical protein
VTRGRGKARRSLELIGASIEILREIQPASVRAISYRLFTLGLIDSMAKNETNRVGRQLVDARVSGAIPWEWIVDETRGVEAAPTWTDPTAFAEAVTRSYRRNKWGAQPTRVEVWSEKGTVRGTLAPVLNRYEVPFRVMHGFASATTVQEIAAASLTSPQPLVALYVGDWDPSGLHMSEADLPARLHTYRANLCEQQGIAWWDEARFAETEITLLRVALNPEDVTTDESELSSFPLDTKRGDPRHGWYLGSGLCVERQGRPQCFELDALSPVVLRERIEAAIMSRLNRPAWDRYVEAEHVERASIEATVRAWAGISMPASECEAAP